jgi:transposase
MMKFYNQLHQFYCGVDLHAKSLHACVVDAQGNKLLHKNFLCQKPQVLLLATAPYKADLVIGCESKFNWSWLADLLREAGLRFILGLALYMKAIHGGKPNHEE